MNDYPMNAETVTADALPLSIAALLRDGPPPLKPEEVDTIYAIGASLYERERYGEASDLFRVIVLCRPTDARGWLALGACHEAASDDERAIALYEVAITAPDTSREGVRAGVYLARILYRNDRVREAREQFEWVSDRIDDEPIDEALAVEYRAVHAMLEEAS